MQLIHKKGTVDPSLIDTKKVRSLINEYLSAFNIAIKPVLDRGIVSEDLSKKFLNDLYLFSGFKTYNELKETSLLLRDTDGQIKPFERFYRDITAIKEDYNRNWLQSEYIFAMQSAMMAEKWQEQTEDGDEFNLQYRTAGDEHVRLEHRPLDRITLPPSDKFWNEFYPPNGWRCRCTVVQVRKGKYPVSDSEKSYRLGQAATYKIDKNGENKSIIFRFNPGKDEVIFPPNHPYYSTKCSNCVRRDNELSATVNQSELCRMCFKLRTSKN